MSINDNNNNNNLNAKDTSIKEKQNNRMKKYDVLTEHSTEQFWIKNNIIKKLNKATEIDNVLLNNYSSFNNKNKNQNSKTSNTTYSISSNQIEFSIISEIKHNNNMEENKKPNINKNETYSQSSEIKLPKENEITNLNNKPKETFNIQQNDEKNNMNNNDSVNKGNNRNYLDKTKDNNLDENKNNNIKDIKNDIMQNEEKLNENKQKEKNKSSSEKNSKQFLKFKTRVMQKKENDSKNKYNSSSKIKKMASHFENKLKRTKSAIIDNDINEEIENKLNAYEIIDKKPVSYNKKKRKKAEFIDN